MSFFFFCLVTDYVAHAVSCALKQRVTYWGDERRWLKIRGPVAHDVTDSCAPARQPFLTYIWGLLQIGGYLIQVNKDGSSGIHLACNLSTVLYIGLGNEPKLLTAFTHACPFAPVVFFTIMMVQMIVDLLHFGPGSEKILAGRLDETKSGRTWHIFASVMAM